jgi:hypothetical protein
MKALVFLILQRSFYVLYVLPHLLRYIYNQRQCGRCKGPVTTWDMAGRTVSAEALVALEHRPCRLCRAPYFQALLHNSKGSCIA